MLVGLDEKTFSFLYKNEDFGPILFCFALLQGGEKRRSGRPRPLSWVCAR